MSASQEIPHILWNQEVHCPVPNSLPLMPFLYQTSPVHMLSQPVSLRSVTVSSSHLSLCLPSGLLPPGFSQMHIFQRSINMHYFRTLD